MKGFSCRRNRVTGTPIRGAAGRAAQPTDAMQTASASGLPAPAKSPVRLRSSGSTGLAPPAARYDVNRAHCQAGARRGARLRQRPRCRAGFGRERLSHEAGEVERTEVASAVRPQRNFSARVHGGDLFAIPGIIELVDAVNEQHAGLGVIVRRPQYALPQSLAFTRHMTRQGTASEAPGILETAKKEASIWSSWPRMGVAGLGVLIIGSQPIKVITYSTIPVLFAIKSRR